MRQCEFKKRYDPDMDLHVRKHTHGEGITDIFKSVGRKVFGRTAKTAAKAAATKAATTAVMNTADYAGKKCGDKIVELLNKKRTGNPLPLMEPGVSSKPKSKVLTAEEANERVNRLLSGGNFGRMRW